MSVQSGHCLQRCPRVPVSNTLASLSFLIMGIVCVNKDTTSGLQACSVLVRKAWRGIEWTSRVLGLHMDLLFKAFPPLSDP